MNNQEEIQHKEGVKNTRLSDVSQENRRNSDSIIRELLNLPSEEEQIAEQKCKDEIAINSVEVDRLNSVIADLTRRLKNAQLTIEAERTIAQNATTQVELYKQEIENLSQILKLESAKSFNIENKSIQQRESQRYEINKVKASELLQEIRTEEVDFWITKHQKEPLKLQRMRKKLVIMENELESQKKLLQEMTEFDQLNESLSTASQIGNIEECKELLIHKGAWINNIDTAGYLPIHYACANGNYDIVQLFLENGSDYSSFLSGHSPIVIAASHGHIDIIELLLHYNANIEDMGSARCPPSIAAMINEHYETFAYFLNETSCNINAYDADENTALHLAVKISDPERSIQVILFLLEKGIDREKVNRKGHTALQVALYDQNKPAAQALGAEFPVDVAQPVGVDETRGGGGRKGQDSKKMTSSSGRHNTTTSAKHSHRGPIHPADPQQSHTGGHHGGKMPPESIHYLPRSIDSPVRPSPAALHSAPAGNSRIHRDIQRAQGMGNPTASPSTTNTRSSGLYGVLNRSAALGMSMPLERRATAVDNLSMQIIHRRQQIQQHVQQPPGPPINTTALCVASSAASVGEQEQSRESQRGGKSLVRRYEGEVPSRPVVPGAVLDGRLHSAESGIEDGASIAAAAAGGFLDSQSVISAVTFEHTSLS